MIQFHLYSFTVKRIAIGLSVLVCGLALTACNSGPTMVGKWQGSIPAQGQSIPATVEYKADKTFVAESSQGGAGFRVSGTYELKEDQMTTTITSATLLNVPQEMAPLKAMAEQEMKKIEGQTETATIKFNGNDEMVSTGPNGQTVTFTRIKE